VEQNLLYQLICPIRPICSNPCLYVKAKLGVAACGALTLCVPPIFSLSFFCILFNSSLLYHYMLFSVGGVKAVACSKESVTQPTHLECLTNYLNQWETKETWNGTTMFTSPSSLNMLAQLLDYTYPCEVSGSKLDFEPIKFTLREGVIKY